MKDFMGTEIVAGANIVYAITKGRSACLVHATVLEIKENGHLRVQPIRDSFGQRRNRKWDRKTLKFYDAPIKPVTLLLHDRLLVLS